MESSKRTAINEVKYNGSKGPKWGVRYSQIILMSLIYAQGFTTKQLFSVANVAMTQNNTSSNPDIPTYHWNSNSNDNLLSAIYWSCIPFNIIAGEVGKRFGPKWILILFSFINNCAFILIPVAVRSSGFIGVLMCRLVQGFALGFLFPQVGVVFGRWIPPEERARMGFASICILQGFLVVGSVASGQIAASTFGWPWIFYSNGIFGFIAICLMMLFGHQSADFHPSITIAERTYLQTTLFKVKKEKTPWKSLLTSQPVWAIIVAQIGCYWFIVLLTTEVASYLSQVMAFDIQNTSSLSVIPSIIGSVIGIGFSIISDILPQRGVLSLLNSRRIFHMSGQLLLSISVFAMTYIPVEYRIWSIVCLCFANIGIVATGFGGSNINMLDLSPKFTGIIMAASLTISQSISLFAPILVGWLVTDKTKQESWRIVFGISGLVAIATSIYYWIFASTKRQKWDTETEQ